MRRRLSTYMSPTLLSTYMFDQEYPLGGKQSVLRGRHAFAIQHLASAALLIART